MENFHSVSLVVPPVLALATGLYWKIGLSDLAATSALRRNFPLLCNFRYVLESLRPEIQQYFIEVTMIVQLLVLLLALLTLLVLALCLPAPYVGRGDAGALLSRDAKRDLQALQGLGRRHGAGHAAAGVR